MPKPTRSVDNPRSPRRASTSQPGRHAGGRAMIRLRIVLVSIGCAAATACDKTPNMPKSVCDITADASKDYLDFLQNYPTILPAARVDLANMLSSLTAALPAATSSGSLFNAIQAAQRAVDDAQTALDDNQPVDTGALNQAMSAIGNLCSQGAGD